MPLTVSNFIAGPLIAFAVIGLLAAVLRWTFGRSGGHPLPPSILDPGAANWLVEPEAAQPEPVPVTTAPADYGLLRAVATVPGLERATEACDRLRRAGIRATVADGADGQRRVLVFETDAGRARRVLVD